MPTPRQRHAQATREPNRGGRPRASLSALLAVVTLALVAAACSDGTSPANDDPVTTLVGVELSEATSTMVDAGQNVEGVVHVRTDATDGVRVWLMPAVAPELRPHVVYRASSLLQGSDLQVPRWFRMAVGDEDRTLDAVRVVVRDAAGDLLLDEEIPTSLTIRSVASTSAPVLAPASGTLEQGDHVDVSIDFELDATRDVEVSVGPMRPDGFDDETQDDWIDVRIVQDQLFEDVNNGTMAGSFTVTDAAVGDVAIDTLYVSMRDLDTMNTIYLKLLDADFTFVEPASADLTVGIVPSRDDATLEPALDALAQGLGDELGLAADAVVADSYAALVDQLAAGTVDVAFLGPAGMVEAIDDHGAIPVSASVRFGATSYRGQFNVRCGETTTFADLVGGTIAFVDPGSTSGYQYPYVHLKNEEGIDPDTDLTAEFAGSHDAAVLAVYNGDADVAATFEDARNVLASAYPDVEDVVCVLGYTNDIPNDGQVVRAGLAAATPAEIRDALVAVAATPDGADAIEALINATGFGSVESAAYDPVRDVLAEFP